MKLEFGKTYYPRAQSTSVSDNLIRGQGWKAERLNGEIIFEFLAARHGGGVDKYEITESEFSALKKGSLSAADLIKKYDKI